MTEVLFSMQGGDAICHKRSHHSKMIDHLMTSNRRYGCSSSLGTVSCTAQRSRCHQSQMMQSLQPSPSPAPAPSAYATATATAIEELLVQSKYNSSD